MHGGSKQFGLLLAHFFGGARVPLSASSAAGLSGFGVKTALSAMQLLEGEGILRSDRSGRRRLFSAAEDSQSYSRCRAVYASRRPAGRRGRF